jgi:Spy/CpxP family protein refolding chaperone
METHKEPSMITGTPRRFFLLAAGIATLSGLSLLAGELTAHPAGDASSTAAGWAPRPFRRAVRRLDLSDDQQAKIRGILKTHADEILAQRKAGTDSRRALHAAQIAQPFDENAIRDRAKDLGAVRADGAVLFAKIRSEIWPILTPDQQDRAKTLRAKGGDRAQKRQEALERWLRQDG